MELFTVDRSGQLFEGLVCELSEHADIEPAELAALVKDICPGGVSYHGEHYLVRNNGLASALDAELEMLFDLVRRIRYPNAPSRYQCIFAVDSMDAVTIMAKKINAKIPRVFKLECENAYRVDMRLLNSNNSPLGKYYLADMYWSGNTLASGEPEWEWLVPCPVMIGEQVI